MPRSRSQSRHVGTVGGSQRDRLGRPEMIAGRGEGILGMRMILTDMPPLGLFYASSPPPLMEKLGPSSDICPRTSSLEES